MSSKGDIVVVVDDNDKVLQYLDEALFSKDMRRRDTAIYLFNNAGQVLIAKRHANKYVLPNCWGPTASGTVESHESYQQNAYKELLEEVSIQGIQLTHAGNFCMDYDGHKRYTGLFFGIYNGDVKQLVLEEDQVESVQWISYEDLRQQTTQNPQDFVPRMIDLLAFITQKK